MITEEILALAEEIFSVATGKYLSGLQKEVLRGALEGQTYEEMVKSLGYASEYIRDVGADLFKLFSNVLGEKVTKRNIRVSLERAYIAKQAQGVPRSKSSLTGINQQPELDPNFVGRESAIADLNRLIEQGAKAIVIHGKGGIGKTMLAWQFLNTQGFDKILDLWMAKETQNITSAESVIEEWLRRYFDEEPGREFGVTLDRLRQHLRNPNQRIGVLIDNLEPALDGNGRCIDAHRKYVELFTALAEPAVQSVTLISSRECLREAAVAVEYYRLEGLDIAAWKKFLNSRNIQIDIEVLNAMHQAYGGNAKAMQIIPGAIKEYNNNLADYWQANKDDLLIERELEGLVASQFNRLQQLDSSAYKLLCRLGCYRYQDVPRVPIEGLFCLLWDVPENQHRRVIKSLRDTSLVEFDNGEYWLHPVIRAEAVKRLRESEDWETANRKAAEFWTESIRTIRTVEDAIKALEAYFHYIEIEDFEQAGAILVQERSNSWDTSYNLSSSLKSSLIGSFCRLGLLQTLSTVLTPVIPKISSNSILCKLYNTLGEVYWRLGSIIKAIEQYKKSREIALEHGYKYLEIDSLYNIGRCQVELWELEEAIKIFEEVIHVSENTEWHTRYVCASFYLAFLYSCLGFQEKAANLADKINREISVHKLGIKSTGIRLFFLGLTYKTIGKHQQALELFQAAVDYAKQVGFNQLLAQATNGLAELYREAHNFELAVTNHLAAIEILDKLGAKSDLAETYYQLGLTYQEIDDYVKGNEHISRAVQIFYEIEAPKQVERISCSLKVRYT